VAEFSLVNRDPELGGYSPEGLPTHEEYSNYIRRWKFLINSYMGGVEYRQGNYLTKYHYESSGEYASRLSQTPMDNHVKSCIHIYNSFLYRNEPKRDFGSLDGPEMEQFLQDCDMEGRTWSSFMRDVNVLSSVYGHVAVLIDRPESQAGTKAEELQQGIRPYSTIYTPENILDWDWERLDSGHYQLRYVRFLEQDDRSYSRSPTYYIRTWTRDEIHLESYKPGKKNPIELVSTRPNPLGKVPVTWVYANRGPIRGIGVSDVGDIADMQNHIYNMYSEAEALIRITNHPTLVKTRETEASAGAGAIVTMPAELDGALKPYLLQPSGQNLEAILKTIDEEVKAIDRMAHLGSIRAIETRQMSGVAMQSEFILLDSKLCEKAKNLQLAEEQMFRDWGLWQGTPFDGQIKYPMAFHIRDKNLDMDILKKAAEAQRDSATATPNVKTIIDQKLMELLAKDEDEMEEMQNQMADQGLEHDPVTGAVDLVTHLREMIEQGYSNEEILTLHPELSTLFKDNNGNVSGQDSNTQ